MKKRLLLLFILFYSLCLTVQAQTDSTKLRRWSLGIGVLSGVNQLRPSTQLHYNEINNYLGGAIVGEAFVQYHLNRKWSVSLGLRYGTRSATSNFENDEIKFMTFTKQNMLEIPLLVGYKWENFHHKEIVSIETGALMGGAATYHSFYRTTFYDYANNIIPYRGADALGAKYYCGVFRLSKSFPLFSSALMKILMEYDLSTYLSSSGHIGYYNNPTTLNFKEDNIGLRYQTLYMGLALIF